MDIITTAVSPITLPSNRIVHAVKADFVERRFPPTVKIVQYDKSLPVIAASLYKSGAVYTIPAGAAVNIRVRKPDNTYVYNAAIGCNNDRQVVYFEVSEQMAAAYGYGRATVELVIGGQIAGTSLILLQIEENPVPEDAIESSNEYQTIYDLYDQIKSTIVNPVATAAEMTDTSIVYLYVGNESGYNKGHMYYYNGSTWVDAGIASTDSTLSVAGMAADAKATGDEISSLKEDLSNTSDIITKISDDSYTMTLISYDEYDSNRSLTSVGKDVTIGSVILSFPVTAGTIIKVSLVNRTGGNILYFFQDQKTVPWDSNTHIIGNINYGDSFYGYIYVPTGATYLVTNGDINNLVSVVSLVGSSNSMKYRGTLSQGAFTNALVGTYAVSNANVTGLPSEMTQAYGWLTCYVPDQLYVLVESNTPKTTWLKEGGSDWVKIYPSGVSGGSRLGGKLIAYNGDSICESRFSGFASNGGGYPYLISQIVGGTYENKAVSGGTLAVSSAGHHICETIAGMNDNADIVCIDGGINDYWLDVPLGDFSESDFTGEVDNTTVCGALESIFRQAINKWVGIPIVFVIVHKITTTAWTTNGAGYTFAQEREKLIGICKKYSIPYVDMWAEGGLNAYMSALNNAFLNGGGNTHPDGCHPDVNGYRKYYVPRLISMFESLLPYDE